MTPVIDAQVHAWADGTSTGHHRRSPVTADVLRTEMAAAGVDRVVLVPPLWDPNGPAYSLELARAEPERFAVMGVVEPAPADPAARAVWLREQPGVRGVRLLFNTPERIAPLLAGAFESFWPAAQEADLLVALLTPGALDRVDEIASRYPGLRLVVDHLGVPRGAKGPGAFDHLPALLDLAKHPNVHVKAAGVGDYALDPFPFRSLDDALRRVVTAFGPERVLWASDLSRLRHPYRQCATHFREALSWLPADDLALVMGGNVTRILNWP
jgi:L-fuconolactonase